MLREGLSGMQKIPNVCPSVKRQKPSAALR